jgi:hypothetical protein
MFEFGDLVVRLTADVLAGAFAGAAVTPVVSAVDRALAESASGKKSLGESFLGAIKDYGQNPLRYLRGPQFLFIWMIYGGTYVVANGVETACAVTRTDPAFPKWVTTSTTNTTTCIIKDRAFARMFGTSVPTNVPKGAYAAWLSRDFVSMGVFFTLPPIVGRELAKYMDGDQNKGYYVAQIALPLVLQTVTTPLHRLGYDIYNKPIASVSERLRFLKTDYWSTVGIRMVRMAPPWSVGTIGNRELRTSFLSLFGKRQLLSTQPLTFASG